ncbi:heat shock 70 kDa protein 12B-like protein [Willisornis vidua]|uniref:Heat shock 70 kDa protein 12B-like protein n=1 Tax=Willisornis vidua TaxID=1566151 RepID=A0ABQ9DRP1_9PASS|nr:heat shock 70 kDa protein 12B-like protein [Willisornis vidua]
MPAAAAAHQEGSISPVCQEFPGQRHVQNVTTGMELEATNEKMLPALTVFSKGLDYLKQYVATVKSKQYALNAIQEASFQTVYDQEEITWVITVLAMWSSAARQFMCLTAKEAGNVSDMLSENLVIALEPEAASLWSKQLPQKGFMADSSDKKRFEDSPGIQYIVVDCGGRIFPV